MESVTLPLGFRFHPTDDELVGYYLKRKVEKLEIELDIIPKIEFYKYDPWELPDKSYLPNRNMEWFFFCPRDRKYPNGSRTNRATKAGYWKATGKDRKIVCGSMIGFRKTLVFYQGRAPHGTRTNWLMHEYRLSDDTQTAHGAFALCRVVKKIALNGNVKGKRVGTSSSNKQLMQNEVSSDYQYNSSNHSSPTSSSYITPRAKNEINPSMGINSSGLWVLPEVILDSSKESSQMEEMSSDRYFQSAFDDISLHPWQSFQRRQGISPTTSYCNFAEIELADDLNQFGCMAPYSANLDFLSHYENVGVFGDSYDENDTLSYQILNSF